MHPCCAALCCVVCLQGTEKRRLPGERETHSQMRVFARYQPPGSHEGFVEGLLLVSRLRLRIAELQSHRAAGRRTLADVSHRPASFGGLCFGVFRCVGLCCLLPFHVNSGVWFAELQSHRAAGRNTLADMSPKACKL